MVAAPEIVAELNANGFAIVEGFLSEDETLRLLAAIERLADIGSKLQRRGEVFAVRNLLDVVPEITKLATSDKLRVLLEPIFGNQFIPVRGILFDKVPEANWKVPWHQDVTIAVQEKVEVEGFGPWTTKAGVIHVQPPASILEHILSVRLHLDPCPASNGALRVIPASHLHGRIPEEGVPAIRAEIPEHVCEVGLGGALLMRPLLLHASSPSQNADHRRVIHLDFASVQLPAGMRWLSESKVS
jgi:ectoine hydroxylase-related dioxygenase (phytanoyl-CoA dioxygenase family)